MDDMLDSKRGYDVFMSKAQLLSDLSDFQPLGRMKDDTAITFKYDDDKPFENDCKEYSLLIVLQDTSNGTYMPVILRHITYGDNGEILWNQTAITDRVFSTYEDAANALPSLFEYTKKENE